MSHSLLAYMFVHLCVCLSQWLNMVIRFKLELEHNKALKLILQIFQKSFLTFFEVRWSRVVKLEWNSYTSFSTTSFGLKFYSKTGFSSINNIFVQMFVNLFLVFCTMGKTTNRGKRGNMVRTYVRMLIKIVFLAKIKHLLASSSCNWVGFIVVNSCS